MSNRYESLLARLGIDYERLIDLRSDKRFQSVEDQEIIDIACCHLISAIYCLHDLGGQRDVDTYDIVSQ